MTDPTTSVSTPTTPTSTEASPVVEVIKPSNAKPYDDELLDAYEAEALAKPATEEKQPQSDTEAESPEATEEATEESTEEEVVEEAKAREGDTVDDGFENVPVKKLINGKEVEFKVKDAIQAYVKQEEFNRNMDRRLAVADAKEKSWDKEVKAFETNVRRLMEVAQQGDFITAVRGIAKLAKGDSDLDIVEFEKAYFEQLDKVHSVYTKMSPAEREAFFAKRAAAEAKAEAEKLRTEREQAVQTSELEATVKAEVGKSGLSEDEFYQNYEFMSGALVGEGKPFQSKDDIGVEHVINYSLRVRHETKVLEAARKAGLEDAETIRRLSDITSTDPSLTPEDILVVIESSGLLKNASPKAVENLNRKVGKTNSRPTSSASSTKKEKDGYDKETLDYLYRNRPRQYARVVR